MMNGPITRQVRSMVPAVMLVALGAAFGRAVSVNTDAETAHTAVACMETQDCGSFYNQRDQEYVGWGMIGGLAAAGLAGLVRSARRKDETPAP